MTGGDISGKLGHVYVVDKALDIVYRNQWDKVEKVYGVDKLDTYRSSNYSY